MRIKLLIGLTVFLSGSATAAAYLYDSSKQDLIADGVTVRGVDVGGLNSFQARELLDEELLAPLRRSVKVKVADRTYTLSARQANVRADLDKTLDTALKHSREGSFASRTVRDLRGQQVNIDIPISLRYSRSAVKKFAQRIKAKTARQSVNATLSFTGNGFRKVAAKEGVTVDERKLQRVVAKRLLRSELAAEVKVKTDRVKPAVTEQQLEQTYPTMIIVNRSTFKLRFYEGLKLKKVYKVAVGKAGLDTPAGLYTIQNKQENPAWHVPNSKWAGKLAGKVIPPNSKRNPIKARWMGIADGAGIHGTAEPASLGSAASHGCVRMSVRDVKELYELVPVGTTIYIA